MFSAKQGNYLVPFYNVFGYDAVLDWGLNPGPPALDASTLPLGYRGGGNSVCDCRHFKKNRLLPTYNVFNQIWSSEIAFLSGIYNIDRCK